jgi:hypothetical protein
LPHAFLSFWIPSLKPVEILLLNTFAQTVLKLFQAARSVSQNVYKDFIFQDFLVLKSREDAFYQFRGADIGKFVTHVLESF